MRRIAFEVLRRVETEGAYAADLLHALLREPAKRATGESRGPLRDRDAALATELTLGVLRWQRLLDFLLDRYVSGPKVRSAGKLDVEIRLALRIGLYQLRFLTRVPPRAAVNESVELARWARKSSAAPLVNAVLRRAASEARAAARRQELSGGTPSISAEGMGSPPTELLNQLEDVARLLPPDLPPAERLGILYSHPTWLVERWLKRFGEQRTVALLETNNRPPRLTCTVHDAMRREETARALGRAGMNVEPGLWLRSALAIRGGNPAETDAFRRGWISIQDEASQMAALLVGVEPGHSVLDLCAAPGGKTALLARAAGPDARVISADLHLHRLRAMREHLLRVGISHTNLVALDAAAPLPFAGNFDRILVDAPCSGTGTLCRNPEIRWRLRPEDLAEFHGRQVNLLSRALERLAAGGRLVYSTCSLEPEENEQVVTEALEGRSEIRRISAAGALAPHLVEHALEESLFDAEGNFRTFPPEHRTDGFFGVILERTRR